jgi:Histidine kinase
MLGLYSGARRGHEQRERELHDAVGHDVSLMVVQAQALGASDERVCEATDEIADLGRRTMAELHRTVRLMRDNDGDEDRRPGGGLADLDELVDRARAAGVPLSVTVDGGPRALAPAVDQSATGSCRSRSPTWSSTPTAPRRRSRSATAPIELTIAGRAARRGMKLSVVIADDQPLMRTGFKTVLEPRSRTCSASSGCASASRQ